MSPLHDSSQEGGGYLLRRRVPPVIHPCPWFSIITFHTVDISLCSHFSLFFFFLHFCSVIEYMGVHFPFNSMNKTFCYNSSAVTFPDSQRSHQNKMRHIDIVRLPSVLSCPPFVLSLELLAQPIRLSTNHINYDILSGWKCSIFSFFDFLSIPLVLMNKLAKCMSRFVR